MTIIQKIMLTLTIVSSCLLFAGAAFENEVMEVIGLLCIIGIGFVGVAALLVGIWIA